MANNDQNEGRARNLGYTVNNFFALNSYVEKLVDRFKILNAINRSRLHKNYAIIFSIIIIAIAVAAVIFAIAFRYFSGDSIFSKTLGEKTIIQYIPVPDPEKSQVIEKPIVVEKPVFIPVEIPIKEGVVSDFTIFQTVEIERDNVERVVTGAKFASSDNKYPSRQWCYANVKKIIGNSNLRVDIGNKTGGAPIIWAELTPAQSVEVDITKETFLALNKSCQFLEFGSVGIDPVKPAPLDPQTGDTGVTGSAFAVNGNGNLVTNEHVVSSCAKIAIRKNKEYFTARLVVKNASLDLAILKVPEYLLPTFVKFSEEIRSGQEVVALGYPLGDVLGDELKVTTGIIASMSGLKGDPDRLHFTAPIQPGSSGGPLMNRKNELVGVNTAGLIGEELQNINFAVKGTVLQKFLAKNGVRFSYAVQNTQMSVPDITDSAKRHVLQVYCTK
jgi:S1-C subfamily serine protease